MNSSFETQAHNFVLHFTPFLCVSKMCTSPDVYALHDGPIAQNELLYLAVVLQDQSPPGHAAPPLLPGTLVDYREPDEDGLYKAAAVWPLGRRTRTHLSTPDVNSTFFLWQKHPLMSLSKIGKAHV